MQDGRIPNGRACAALEIPGERDEREKEQRKEMVKWSSLPHKGQLALLTMSRFSEGLINTSLQVCREELQSVCAIRDVEHTSYTNSKYLIRQFMLTALQSYLFYQLKSFDNELPDAQIAVQAGLMWSAFTGAQVFTALICGSLSDNPRIGRKSVILTGLVGSSKCFVQMSGLD